MNIYLTLLFLLISQFCANCCCLKSTENGSEQSKSKDKKLNSKINLENNNIIEEFRSLCNRYKNNIKDVIVQLNEIDKSID